MLYNTRKHSDKGQHLHDMGIRILKKVGVILTQAHK